MGHRLQTRGMFEDRTGQDRGQGQENKDRAGAELNAGRSRGQIEAKIVAIQG